ncbi:MAG: IS1595 family transposase [Bacteroidia bacterium]|nr:IS1595 family transposase [Bacteroidia bacterium]
MAAVKWEEGYTCRKCRCEKYIKGSKPHNRRCLRCKYDESPTAATSFDKLKFPILVAFHIAFSISTRKKGMSSIELSEEFGLRQKTCWEFRRKLQSVMGIREHEKLSGVIHTGTSTLGKGDDSPDVDGPAEISLAIENVPNGKVHASISGGSPIDMALFLSNYINHTESTIYANNWKGFAPEKKAFKELDHVSLLPTKDKKHTLMHIHIKNLKNWLYGIHHHFSKEHLQGYLNEYHFRHNAKSEMDIVFDKLIVRLVK